MHLLTDADYWQEGAGRGWRWGECSSAQPQTVHPFPRQGGRQGPTLIGLPKGDALQRQGVRAPQLLLLSPSLDQLALLVLFLILFRDPPERSTTLILSKSLDLFGLSFLICKMGAIIVSPSLGCFEDPMRATRKALAWCLVHSEHSVNCDSHYKYYRGLLHQWPAVE